MKLKSLQSSANRMNSPVQVFDGDGDDNYTPIILEPPYWWNGGYVTVNKVSEAITVLLIQHPDIQTRTFCNAWKRTGGHRPVYINSVTVTDYTGKTVYDCEKSKRVVRIKKRRQKTMAFEIELIIEKPRGVQVEDGHG